MSYAWIIDTDHMPDEQAPEGTNGNARGVTGPRNANQWMVDRLGDPGLSDVSARIFTFEMRDSDGELYYTGRLIADDGERETLRDGVTETISERACYAPLADFGMPNAGAVEITYPGHKDMDCG